MPVRVLVLVMMVEEAPSGKFMSDAIEGARAGFAVGETREWREPRMRVRG